ncbi:hypothetical protein [Bacillus thuringiensis]|uniref:hypothetical protein n=1 Tax=Bacillus thuringiensis TaxID=1428 RepID=UPI0018749F92|nr:hypothetical protein [Bacillus thuringiensis]MBE5096473.1 hypothetical protein [Bacillus thuringiensis]
MNNLLIMKDAKKQIKKDVEIVSTLVFLDSIMEGKFTIGEDYELTFNCTEQEFQEILQHFERMKKTLISADKIEQELVARAVAVQYIRTKGKCATFLKMSALLKAQAAQVIKNTDQYDMKFVQALVEQSDTWHEIENRATEIAMSL